MTTARFRIASLVATALGRLFTAASIRVEGSRYVFSVADGRIGPDIPTPISSETRFDLASVTKVFTSTAILRLVDAGAIGLDDPLHKFLPAYGSTPVRQLVTLKRLLSHQAGMPRSLGNMYYVGRSDQEIWESFLAARWRMLERVLLDKRPGTMAYTDIGPMLLGRVVEITTGNTLDQAVQDLVCKPLALNGSGFGGDHGSPVTKFGLEPGRVHDRKTLALGGVSGCAGMFSTAADVSRLARAYLPGSTFLTGELRREALREDARDDVKKLRRSLGWELRSTLAGEPETPLDSSAYGQTGFTGTMVWTDPTRNLTITILTNGVLFGHRWNSPLTDFYRSVVDVAVGIEGPEAKFQID